MPPVRWKDMTILIISASIVQQIGSTKSPNIAESYSIITDGWTPIIGHKNRDEQSAGNNGEITMYRNPASKSSEPVKAEKLHITAPIPPSTPNNVNAKSKNQQKSPNHLHHLQQHQIRGINKNTTSSQSHPATSNKPIIGHGISGGLNVNTITSGSNIGGKIPPHSKPLLILPSSHNHGPHIPLNLLTAANTPVHRPLPPKNNLPLGPLPQMNKYHHQYYPHAHGHHPHGHGHGVLAPVPKRSHLKPTIVVAAQQPPQVTRQVAAHSIRDEVFVPAPQQIGAFGFFTQPNPNQFKTRITQPHGHIEFTNHFGISPSSDQSPYSLSRVPIQQYIVPKHPAINDVHYAYQGEDFTRNLVPPPVYSINHEQAERQKNTKPIYKHHGSESVVTEDYQQEKKKQNQFIRNYASPEKTVEVQVTKEQLKVYHGNLPNSFNIPSEYEFGSYQTIKRPNDAPKQATYEVTEGKQWQETQPYYQPFSTRAPHKSRRPQHAQSANNNDVKPFLPTPFKPEYAQPTIATQSEISTIYNQLSHRNKHRDRESNFHPNSPSFFSVKEVSTHFPVVGQPAERPDFITQPPQISYTTDPPEITTNQRLKDFDFAQVDEESTIPPTRQPAYGNRGSVTRKRPQQRRRRPGIRNKYQPVEEAEAVTDMVQKVQEPESEETTEKIRLKRPNRHRTTESTLIEKEDEKMSAIRSRNRYRTTKATTTEQSIVETTNRQIGIQEDGEELVNHEVQEQERFIPRVVTEKDFPESFADQFKPNIHKAENYPTTSPSQEVVEIKRNKPIFSESSEDEFQSFFFHPKPTDLSDVTIYEANKAVSNKEVQFKDITEPSYEIRKPAVEEYDLQLYNGRKESVPNNIMKVEDFQSSSERSRFQSITTQANIPENEIDYTTMLSIVESATAMDIYKDHKIATTTEGTTPTVTRPSRIRGRPAPTGNRFETNRPRFSVKDYRQRSTTSTEAPAKQPANLETSTRIRFPNRSRRPLTTSTTQKQDIHDESTERSKSYEYHKHQSNSKDENEASFAEKHFKGNTRRPFGRNRSTTESTTTTKVSIKPNIFNNLKRPTPISLRNRILNRQNKTTVAPTTTTAEVFTADPSEETNETDLSEIIQSTLPYHNTADATTTEFGAKKTVDIEVAYKDMSSDILKNESFMYSQRVSDLTSSSKNDYNTPGRFKNVPTSSRRVPSYFTLATDEPILPIQAFFPNIKDKS